MTDTADNSSRDDLTMLVEIAKSLAAEKDLDKLLGLVTHSATRLLRAGRSSLYLYDAERDIICTRVIEADEIKEVCLPIGRGIAGTVAATHALINIPDCYEDGRFDPSWDRRTGFRTCNMLCAPMLNHEGDLIGVLQVINKCEGCFTQRDEDLILALGSLAAVSLDNDRLIRHYLEKRQLEHSLDIARSIQQSLLPDELPDAPGFALAASCDPCDQTGGDYFDAIALPDGRLGLVIGDVTGHGIGPAILMAESRALMRAAFLQSGDIPQTMRTVNDLLEQDLTDGRFVTLFFGVLDPSARTLHYSSAGHTMPMHYRRDGGEVSDLPATGPPLGIVPGLDYPMGEPVRFEPGDVLLLTTDGVEESADASNELFGRDRLAETLRSLTARPPREMIDGIQQALRAYRGGAEIKDDVTIVAICAWDETVIRRDGDTVIR